MRIHVNPDGNVEFSVDLSPQVDPSLVASMVAAVRRGIVSTSHQQLPNPPPTSSQTHFTHQQHHISDHTTPPDPTEPTSDPDPDTLRAPDRICERVPSPLVVSSARRLSVRQIAAEIEGRPEPRLTKPYNEYDPVREFSSSPALWLNSHHLAHADPEPPRSQSSAYSLRVSASEYDIKPPRRLRTERAADRTVDPRNPTTPPKYPRHQSSSRPVRMLSLPNGNTNDNINDVYILRRQSEHTAHEPHLEEHSYRRDASLTLDNIQDGDILVEERAIVRQDHLADEFINKPNPASSHRSISDLTDSHGMDVERSVTPSSPYMQQQIVDEDPNDAWNDVEYVLTDSYRNPQKPSDIEERDSNPAPSTPRSAAWRIFSSIGTSLRRRQDTADDLHQGTLASGTGYADKFTKRRRALFTRSNVRNGTLWMEFTSPLALERMLAEVGKIAKAMGYQVWRRPGENKLRCIRRLTHRHEMHLVILVGSIRVPEGLLSVVRLRRARGDRNRTEGWRYAHFYRELIDRLQRHGVEITAGE